MRKQKPQSTPVLNASDDKDPAPRELGSKPAEVKAVFISGLGSHPGAGLDSLWTRRMYTGPESWLVGLAADIHLTNGELEVAEKELRKLYTNDKNDPANLRDLGKLYEQKRLPSEAEEYYARGLEAEEERRSRNPMLRKRPNQCEEALRRLFETRGVGKSWDAYLEGIQARLSQG